MRQGIGLSSLVWMATLAALGVWLLGGCASTTSTVENRVGRSEPPGHWRPCDSHPSSIALVCYQR